MEILNLDHSLFIKGYHISTELCDEILYEQQGKKKLFYQPAIRKEFRGYTCMPLYDLSKDLHERYLLELETFKRHYIEQYSYLKRVWEITYEPIDPISNIPNIVLQKYQPGRHYSLEHCEYTYDNDPLTDNRILGFTTYLNDIQEGGGTHFSYQNFTSTPKKGLTLIWPAYFTHVHKGIPAPKEIKYILTGWFRVYDNNIVPSS